MTENELSIADKFPREFFEYIEQRTNVEKEIIEIKEDFKEEKRIFGRLFLATFLVCLILGSPLIICGSLIKVNIIYVPNVNLAFGLMLGFGLFFSSPFVTGPLFWIAINIVELIKIIKQKKLKKQIQNKITKIKLEADQNE